MVVWNQMPHVVERYYRLGSIVCKRIDVRTTHVQAMSQELSLYVCARSGASLAPFTLFGNMSVRTRSCKCLDVRTPLRRPSCGTCQFPLFKPNVPKFVGIICAFQCWQLALLRSSQDNCTPAPTMVHQHICQVFHCYITSPGRRPI